MLEFLFQAFFEWIYGLILEAWEYFSSGLIDLMSMDFAYLQTHIPVLPMIRQSMLAVGWALLIGNLVFQAVRSMMTGLGFEAEDPKLLFARTFVFSFLLLASPQLCELCLNMTSTVIRIMELPDAVNIDIIHESAFDGLACAWLLVFICGIIVMFQSFKLIFEMAERYVILAMLTICAPLAFGMGGSKNTNDIFSGWCRMYGSMCLLMVLNVVFVKMLLSVLSTVPTGLAVLPWMVLVLSIVKVAKKADAIVSRIGLNPAITGESLGRTLPGMLSYIVLHTAASHAVQSAWRSIGKSGKTPASGTRGAKESTSGAGFRGSQSGSANKAQTTSKEQSRRSEASKQRETARGTQTAGNPGRNVFAAKPVFVSAEDFDDGGKNAPAAKPTAQREQQTLSGAAGITPTRKTERSEAKGKPLAESSLHRAAQQTQRTAKSTIRKESGSSTRQTATEKAPIPSPRSGTAGMGGVAPNADTAAVSERRGRNTHINTQRAVHSNETALTKTARQEKPQSQAVVPSESTHDKRFGNGTAGTETQKEPTRRSLRENPGIAVSPQPTREQGTTGQKAFSPAQQERNPTPTAMPSAKPQAQRFSNGIAGTETRLFMPEGAIQTAPDHPLSAGKADAPARQEKQRNQSLKQTGNAPAAPNFGTAGTPALKQASKVETPLRATGKNTASRKSSVKKGDRKKHGRS